MFGFLKRKKKDPPKAGADPIAAFDGMIESLERQGAEVRKSAATLLALRGELQRDRKKYAGRVETLTQRLETAARDGEAKVERTFRNDLLDCQRLLEKTEEALANSEANVKLLLEAAEELTREVTALREERLSAHARFSTGVTMSHALQARAAEFDRVMKLDAARDEIERANALAELYREDHASKR
jgi:phage shock protein A